MAHISFELNKVLFHQSAKLFKFVLSYNLMLTKSLLSRQTKLLVY